MRLPPNKRIGERPDTISNRINERHRRLPKRRPHALHRLRTSHQISHLTPHTTPRSPAASTVVHPGEVLARPGELPAAHAFVSFGMTVNPLPPHFAQKLAPP